MSRWVVDASLTLGWYLQDEQDRTYNLEVLAGLKENEGVRPSNSTRTYALLPLLVGNVLPPETSRSAVRHQELHKSYLYSCNLFRICNLQTLLDARTADPALSRVMSVHGSVHEKPPNTEEQPGMM